MHVSNNDDPLSVNPIPEMYRFLEHGLKMIYHYRAPQPARSPALLAGRASVPHQYSPKILYRHAKVLFEAAFSNHTPGACSKTAELLL